MIAGVAFMLFYKKGPSGSLYVNAHAPFPAAGGACVLLNGFTLAPHRRWPATSLVNRSLRTPRDHRHLSCGCGIPCRRVMPTLEYETLLAEAARCERYLDHLHPADAGHLGLVPAQAQGRREAQSRGEKGCRVRGAGRTFSLHPIIDPAICVGCGSCVRACPEQPEHMVLGLINGKANLITAGDCIGHGACRAACPGGRHLAGVRFREARRGSPPCRPTSSPACRASSSPVSWEAWA